MGKNLTRFKDFYRFSIRYTGVIIVSAMITTLLVCDQRLWRQGLRALIERGRTFKVVGEAADDQEAFVLAVEKAPHLILMASDLSPLDGIQATRQILGRRPETRILFLAPGADRAQVAAALEAGARGILLLGADHAEFLRILKSLAKDRPIVSPFLLTHPGAATEVREGQGQGTSDEVPASLRALLTRREEDVFRLALRGLSNRALAEALGVSLDTVKTHLKHLYSKLGVKSRVELVLRFASQMPGRLEAVKAS